MRHKKQQQSIIQVNRTHLKEGLEQIEAERAAAVGKIQQDE